MAELVDALDLKSNVRKSVPVRVRPVAPYKYFMRYLILLLFLLGCASEEGYPPKWVTVSSSLPNMEGYRHAGFFTMNDTIYSHYCDTNGNMIRMRYQDDGHHRRQIKYETGGCGK